jgi:glycolate oxidase
MLMPKPEPAIIARRSELASGLRAIVPAGSIISDDPGLKVFETDALTAYRQPPMLAVLPETTAQVSEILKLCSALGVKVVPRGAGTSLSGGALPLADGLLIGLSKFNRILDIDLANRVVVAQPGVTNLGITDAVSASGFYYAPDPSSQLACTIGGNVAENSGGIHCLKYGLTTNNILGLEVVLMSGEIVRLGGKHFDAGGYDLMGVVCGSEGLLGVITEVTVRILPRPEIQRAMLLGFSSAEAAGHCVARIIEGGVIPAGIEMMDRAAVAVTDDFANAGYPRDVEALLIVELDGPAAEVDFELERVTEIAAACLASPIRASADEAERQRFWAGRKAAFGALGKLAPDFMCMDGTIPRRCLADVLARIGMLSKQFGLGVVNVFHAGDGNLHPLILYDANQPGQLEKAEAFGAEILKLCVEVGGVLTGEHGVGVEKRDLMPLMFSEIDLAHQERLKCAFDPEHRLNPGKMFPVLHRCAELGRMHVHKGQVKFPHLPRF